MCPNLLKKPINFFLMVFVMSAIGLWNINSVCFSCGSQSHKFDVCEFNYKNIALKMEKFQEFSQVDDTFGFYNENRIDIQDADWVEVYLKRAPRSNWNQDKVAGKINQMFILVLRI